MTHFPAVVRGFSCFILLAGVSACTYLIPDDVSTPRNNIVQGDRHKPMRNSKVPQNVSAPQNGAALQPSVMDAQIAVAAAPVVPVAVNPLGVPVASSIEYPQFAPVVSPTSLSGPIGLRQAPVENPGSSVPLASVRRSTPIDTKPMDVAAVNAPTLRRSPADNNDVNVASANAPVVRRNPIENGTFLMAQNTAPQGLNSVPPRPVTGPDSTSARLGEVRKDLEQTRTTSTGARDQLSRDVAAEPSVFTKPAISPASPETLSPLPASVAPLAAPAAPVPTPAMAPSSPVPSSITPPIKAAPEAMYVAPAPVVALNTPASIMPAAPLAPLPQVAPAPVKQTARMLPPIQLKSPAPMELAAVSPVPAASKNTARGFDPMVALPPEPVAVAAAPAVPALPPITLTAPPARVEQPVVAQAPAPVAPVRNMVASNSAFNPLEGDSDSSDGKSRTLQYLTPSRYTYRR